MPEPPDDPRQFFIDNLPLIERAIQHAARKLRPEDREEFGSWVKEKLLENDGAILRKCRNPDRPASFFGAVVSNLRKDFLNRLWGKYRPSKEAQALGPTAVHLERLLVRDDYSFAEACEILRTNFKEESSVAELADLAARLPNRTGRHLEGDDALRHRPSGEETPDQQFVATERQQLAERVFGALTRVLEALPSEDRMLLRLHFEEGWTWANVARSLQLEQRAFYGRVEKMLAGLKISLKEEGFEDEDLREVLRGAGLSFWLKNRGKSLGSPSKV